MATACESNARSLNCTVAEIPERCTLPTTPMNEMFVDFGRMLDNCVSVGGSRNMKKHLGHCMSREQSGAFAGELS